MLFCSILGTSEREVEGGRKREKWREGREKKERVYQVERKRERERESEMEREINEKRGQENYNTCRL